jgi:hypothetical protein
MSWSEIDALKEVYRVVRKPTAWLSLHNRGIKHQKPFASVVLEYPGSRAGYTCRVRWDAERRELVFTLMLRKPILCRAIPLRSIPNATEPLEVANRSRRDSWGRLSLDQLATLLIAFTTAYPLVDLG